MAKIGPRNHASTLKIPYFGRFIGSHGHNLALTDLFSTFLGALSDMPAVRAFALYAGMALLIDFFMQITCFVALIALDMARQENNRWDVFCCVKDSKKDHALSEGMLYKLFKYLYAPALMKKWVRASVMIVFFGWLCSSLGNCFFNSNFNVFIRFLIKSRCFLMQIFFKSVNIWPSYDFSISGAHES